MSAMPGHSWPSMPEVVPQICAGASDEVLISGGYDQAVRVGGDLLIRECVLQRVICEASLQLTDHIGLPALQPALSAWISLAASCDLVQGPDRDS